MIKQLICKKRESKKGKRQWCKEIVERRNGKYKKNTKKERKKLWQKGKEKRVRKSVMNTK